MGFTRGGGKVRSIVLSATNYPIRTPTGQMATQYVLFLGNHGANPFGGPVISTIGTTSPLDDDDRPARLTIPHTIGQWYDLKQPLELKYTAEERKRTDAITRQMANPFPGVNIDPNAGGGLGWQQLTEAMQQPVAHVERIVRLTEELTAITRSAQ